MINISQYDTKYYKLSQFIGGYFHQNWKSTHPWNNREPNWKIVVSDYYKTEPKDSVKQVIEELKQLLSENISDNDLKSILDEFGSAVYAPGLGFDSYHSWMNAILDILTQNS